MNSLFAGGWQDCIIWIQDTLDVSYDVALIVFALLFVGANWAFYARNGANKDRQKAAKMAAPIVAEPPTSPHDRVQDERPISGATAAPRVGAGDRCETPPCG
jgi:hypothetical protein